MRVSEYIRLLQGFPPDAQVVVRDRGISSSAVEMMEAGCPFACNARRVSRDDFVRDECGKLRVVVVN